MADASQLYKKANAQAQAPLDASSSLSALEESPFSSSGGKGGEATSSSAIEGSSSRDKPLKTTATVHVSGSSQPSSLTHDKEQTVIQMDTDEADKQWELGVSSGPGEGTGRGESARSKNPDLQTQESVEFRGEVGGCQSNTGGVHSVANETVLTSRASSSSSHASTHRDTTLEHLSYSQFLDPQSRGSSRASASATRDDSSQSSRPAYMSISRDASLSFYPDATYRAFGDPALASSPRRPFEDFSRDPPSIGSRPATPYADVLKEVLQTVHMPDLMVRGLPPPSSP